MSHNNRIGVTEEQKLKKSWDYYKCQNLRRILTVLLFYFRSLIFNLKLVILII